MSETDVCFQNHIHRVRPYGKVNPFYLYHFFQRLNFNGEIDNYRKGMGISNMSAKSLASISIPLPPVREQQMIVDFLYDFGKNTKDEDREYFDLTIENQILSIQRGQIHNRQTTTELSNQLELVRQLRQAFLREAMQGKLVPQNEADEPAKTVLGNIKRERQNSSPKRR